MRTTDDLVHFLRDFREGGIANFSLTSGTIDMLKESADLLEWYGHQSRKLIANLYAFHDFVTPGTHRLRFSSKREAKRFFRDIKRSIKRWHEVCK